MCCVGGVRVRVKGQRGQLGEGGFRVWRASTGVRESGSWNLKEQLNDTTR